MNNSLEKIKKDIKSIPINELALLAGEIRREIIETVSRNGGHLAPNLGVVELTIALHRVFDTPSDKIIWDVGHQCYVHKYITGRACEFLRLRKYGGISGFPSPEESSHDAFATGHSSTSISAALGMAIARDLQGEKHSVIAVIGDGAMTGGMAFEAMNHAGHLQKKVIVILNDNEMSISANVGGMSRYLTRIRTDPMYSRRKEEMEQLLKKIPAIGPRVLWAVDKLKDSLKYMIMPGVFFEELGFVYLGPIDGHNIQDMTVVLRQARAMSGPVLVHVITKKGKGYSHAEKNPGKFHGIGPFDVETGIVRKKNQHPSYTDVFGSELVRLAEKDSKIVAITAAMPDGTGLNAFARAYPDRFFDVGIAEQHAVTMAAAMASNGLRPVVAIYSTFLQRAYDQIIHDICFQNLPVTLALDRAGLVGDDGPTHHGLYDLSYLRQMPNMVVMAPKDSGELKAMLKTAVQYNGPVAIRYPRGEGRCSGEKKGDIVPVGVAEVIRDGQDITLLAIGSMVELAEKAAVILEGEGISAAVINARFAKPLDSACIAEYARRTGRIVTLEENLLAGGFGGAVLELLSSMDIDRVKVESMGIPDRFVGFGDRDLLLKDQGLTIEELVKRSIIMMGIRNFGDVKETGGRKNRSRTAGGRRLG